MPSAGYDLENLGASQEEVAFRLRAVRESMGFSLREFAEGLRDMGRGVSHTAVTKYERGDLRITPDYLDLVSAFSKVPYGWFLSGLSSEDVPLATPALLSAGLDVLPAYLHKSLSSRLEGLADWCGIPPGPALDEFFADVGHLLKAPFLESRGSVQPLNEISERVLSVYMAMQFSILRTVLRRFGDLA